MILEDEMEERDEDKIKPSIRIRSFSWLLNIISNI